VHVPVLLEEVIEYLNPQPNENFIDCTFGYGGHSLEIFKRIKPDGKILGIEWDAKTIEAVEAGNKKLEFGQNLILVNDTYSNLKNIVEKNNFYSVNGILFDLGISSWDIEKSGRGFSFLRKEPLDMRFNENNLLTAREIINKWPEEKLADIFYQYGEERRARVVARHIISARKEKSIETTIDLAEIIKKAMPARNALRSMAGGPVRQRFGRIHPATRVFQALRIAVNDELGNLVAGLKDSLEILAPGGRIAVISFHSLEDRIVKNFFRDKFKEGKLKILTKKPVIAGEEEVARNPRSRSSKLRVAEKM
jgi:16S rRNA (cytosine1402-N4)-methyltransferase